MSIRHTKYTTAVQDALSALGHATNQDIREYLVKRGHQVSATTVHRVTTRLHDNKLIGLAPNAQGGVMRYDATVDVHDHFICDGCDQIRDVDISHVVKPLLREQLDGCRIGGNVALHGICKLCVKEGL